MSLWLLVCRQFAFSYWLCLTPKQYVLPKAFLCDVQKPIWGGAVWSIVANYWSRSDPAQVLSPGKTGSMQALGFGPASRSSMVPGPAGTKAGRSVAPEVPLPLAHLQDVQCFSPALVQLPARGVAASVWWLTWQERRQLVQNWFIFKIMTIWARPANKNALGKKSFLVGRQGEIPTSCCEAGFVPGGGVKCPEVSLCLPAHLCMCTVFLWVRMLPSCKTSLFYS